MQMTKYRGLPKTVRFALQLLEAGYAKASGQLIVLKTMFKIESKTLRLVVISQLVVVFLFLSMTISNEVLDLPHYFFGDKATSFEQRTGEVIIELGILSLIIIIEIILIRKLYQRIRILEGFLPICANCKKIRHEENWDQVEKYITEHSLAQFSHSICPDCMKKLYPEVYDKKIE